jgi:hypothetical protein
MNHFTSTVFLTMVRSQREKKCAHLLIDSIRTFGGELRNSPIWIFEANPQEASCHEFLIDGAQVFPLKIPHTLGNYWFADKVCACAQAEEMATSPIESFIWMDPTVVCVQPPTLFSLGSDLNAAFRPVHIRNVGIPADAPLDEYWQTIYRKIGLYDKGMMVESFVDAQHLRAYFNTHAFAVSPSWSLFNLWSCCFESLVCDAVFQSRACQDTRHQIFLHQAILSALVATMSEPESIRILPPEYNYPLHLHSQIPVSRRAKKLNALVCMVYEDQMPYPHELIDVQVDEPLETWLLARI